MQAFFYHPIHGATAVSDSWSSMPFRCPQCGQGHGISGIWGRLSRKPEKICPGCEQKNVDKDASLTENKSMCMTNVRFVTAVALAVQHLRAIAPFSAHNITTYLRDKVNCGELTFIDKSTEDVNGQTTYRIDHGEVRDVFRELLHNQLVTGLRSRNAGGYMEYVEKQDAAQPAAFVQPPPAFVAANQSTSTITTTSVGNNDLHQKIREYLKGRHGNVTLKEIQSRFKGRTETCQDYATVLGQMGITLYKAGALSKWYVIA